MVVLQIEGKKDGLPRPWGRTHCTRFARLKKEAVAPPAWSAVL
jgi:hypothetical protein